MPGEPREARELGVDTPRDGLYLREEVDMRCNIMMTGFVKKNLKNAHKVLVDRLLKKVEFVEEDQYQQAMSSPSIRSSIMSSSVTPAPEQFLYQRSDGSVTDDAYKYGGRPGSLIAANGQQQYQPYTGYENPAKYPSPPPHYWPSLHQKDDWKTGHFSQRNPHPIPPSRAPSGQSFAAELPGSAVVMSAELYSPRPAQNSVASPTIPQEKEAS